MEFLFNGSAGNWSAPSKVRLRGVDTKLHWVITTDSRGWFKTIESSPALIAAAVIEAESLMRVMSRCKEQDQELMDAIRIRDLVYDSVVHSSRKEDPVEEGVVG